MKSLSKLWILAATICTLLCCNRELTIQKIDLNKTELEIVRGESSVLKATIVPESLSGETVSWSSSDNSIAVVSDGVVTGLAIGTATITASAGDAKAECIVSVIGIPAEKVVLSTDELSMFKGEVKTISARVLPENADDKTIVWKSSDESIATVDSHGNITGIKPGEASIIAECGKQGAACKVTVNGIPVEKIILDRYEINMFTGESIQLLATVLPENADDKAVTWESSNEIVATVNYDGTITAMAGGQAKITASAGGKTAECNINVTNKPAKDGDYFYSDGTFSTEYDKSKQVIGIVFYVGDPSINDGTLKEEHPECTHGLVVSISGDYISTWQPKYEQYNNTITNWVLANTSYHTIEVGMGNDPGDRLNKLTGYNNTKAIEAFNAAPENKEWPVEAVSYLEEVREKLPAPENTSGWYLPSAKELSLLCTGPYDGNIGDISGSGDYYIQHKRAINERIQTVDGGEILGGDDSPAGYWASSEITKSNATFTFFSYGTTFNIVKKDAQSEDKYRVRYILAF